MPHLEHQSRQRLAHLVVKLAGQTTALCLLGRKSTSRTLTPFGLKSLKHSVEAIGQLVDLRTRPTEPHPLARGQWVNLAHEPRKLFQRTHRPSQQEEVDDHHQRHAEGDHRRLDRQGRTADRRWRQGQCDAGQHQEKGVGQEDLPEELYATLRSHAMDCGTPAVGSKWGLGCIRRPELRRVERESPAGPGDIAGGPLATARSARSQREP
jgi:hypothetical protein